MNSKSIIAGTEIINGWKNTEDSIGTKTSSHYVNGKLHSINDLPARVVSLGEWIRWEWYKGRHLHRHSGPAVIENNGFKAWYSNGVFIREENRNSPNSFIEKMVKHQIEFNNEMNKKTKEIINKSIKE